MTSDGAPDCKAISILLIEDSEADAGLIKAYLARSTAPPFTLIHECDLRGGLDRLRAQAVDAVVLDLNLPDSVGIESYNHVAEVAGDAPVIILSGMQDERLALEAVRRGAQDYFSKEEAISPSLGRLIQYSIERHLRQRAESEIASAAYVQRRLYPQGSPDFPNCDVAGRCDAANEIGGDYYDYIWQDGRLLLVVADVAGHGFGPALVMCEVRAALRTMAVMGAPVDVMVEHVNQLLCSDRVQKFVTLFIASIHLESGECQYASAGHPAEWFRHGDATLLDSDDYPLGIHDSKRYEVRTINLSAGDVLLLYTDGITERAADLRELFGLQRLRNIVSNTGEQPAAEMLEAVFAAANRYAHDRPPTDDMTAIVFKYGS